MTKIYRYKVFNLILHSEDLEIPDLPETKSKITPDIEVKQEDSSLWPRLQETKEDTYFIKIAKDEIRLTIDGIGLFRMTNGNKIAWDKHVGIPDRDILNIILGSGLGSILIQKKMLVFHGNALSKNGKAIICLGSSGAGKSTLAYALTELGWDLISDDLVAVKSNLVLPGIPRIKLWQDAIDAFNLDSEKLPRVRDKINKYILVDKKNCNMFKPIKIEKIYLIGNKKQPKIVQHSIDTEKAVFIGLRNNLFRPRFVRGLGKEGFIFQTLTNMQNSLNVSILSLPNNINIMKKDLKKFDLIDNN